jgi:uncharacterized protein YggE
MRRLAFPAAFLVLLALSLALSSCGDGGPAADERRLDPAGITVQKGPPVAAIFPIGGGVGGDNVPAIQADSTAIGITGTGYGKATAPADTAVLQFALSAWPKGFGPVAILCASGCTPRPTSAVGIGDLFAEETLRTVIDAVATAGGDRDSIKIDVTEQTLPHMLPQSQPTYSEPKVNGTLSVTVREIENVAAVAQAGLDAVAALTEIDAQLDMISLAYQVTDCATLRHAAGQAAAEDAAENARDTAALLGLNVGAIVGASNYMNQTGYQQPAETDCSASGGSIAVTPGGGLTAPPGDVEVSAQISVTYAVQ